jgi:amidohydrolase
MIEIEAIKKEAECLREEIVAWRRHIHQYPELGFETKETEAFVSGLLREWGLEVRTGVAGHGVVALLKGGKEGRTIAIRADMDALPVKEETGLPFASEIEGCMHACAHDAHTAMALGAAKVLSKHKEEIEGNVKFIFQPAEETVGGAKPMIDDGALENPKVDEIIGLHTGCLWPSQKVGEVYVSYGPMMASADIIKVKIKGMGGHGALPHQAVDPVLIAAYAIVALQSLVSREISPTVPAVITIGTIEGGTAPNIISGDVSFSGSVRALSQEQREFLEKRIYEVLQGVVSGMRGELEYRYIYGYPPLVNDEKITADLADVAKNVVGSEHVKTIPEPVMGAEDMAYFLNYTRGTYFFLSGCNLRKGQIYPHHNSKFDIDEDVLSVGTAILSSFALRGQIKTKI